MAEKAEPQIIQKDPDLEEFMKLDIRVGQLKEVWIHPESDKLYCEKIDCGESEIREIASGLQQFISIEEMLKSSDGFVFVLANLKPRKLAGFNSNGMILCASNADHTKVEILRPTGSKLYVKIGERVQLENEVIFPQEKQQPLNPKKKTLEKMLPFLKTNENKEACFKNLRWKTLDGGTVICQTLSNGQIS